MTTTPTPVERAAALLHNLIALLPGVDHHRMREHAERVARAVVAAALDVDEIARVLAEHSDYGSAGPGWTCVCGAPIAATSTTASGLFRAHQAAALIEHLTGVTR